MECPLYSQGHSDGTPSVIHVSGVSGDIARASLFDLPTQNESTVRMKQRWPVQSRTSHFS